MIKNTKSGLTLIELLIVIAVVAIMSTIILSNIGKARMNARDAQRKSDIVLIQGALERYYLKHGQYPNSTHPSDSVPGSGWTNSAVANHWDQLADDLDLQLPKDPLNTIGFSGNTGPIHSYSYFSAGYGCEKQWYMLVYKLERDAELTTASSQSTGVKTCSATPPNHYGFSNGFKYRYGSTTVGTSPKQPL